MYFANIYVSLLDLIADGIEVSLDVLAQGFPFLLGNDMQITGLAMSLVASSEGANELMAQIRRQDMKEMCPRGNNKVVIYISLYRDKCLLFMLELY